MEPSNEIKNNIDKLNSHIEHLKKYLNKDTIDSFTQLDRLQKLTELNKLHSLDQLTNLNLLDNLSQLQHLNQLDHLNKLDKLSSLVKLDELDALSKLTQLDNLSKLTNLNDLDKLENLANLEKLQKLDELNNLREINKLESLNKIDELNDTLSRDLAKLDKLTELRKLDTIDKFSDVIERRSDQFENIKKLDLLSELSNLQELNNLKKLDKIEDLSNLERLENLSKLSGLDNLTELHNLSKLDNLNNLSSLDKLDKLDKLTNLDFLERIDKLETMINDGSLEKLEKLDKIDVLQQEKKKIVFSSFLQSGFDFVKITAICLILTFVIVRTNSSDSRVALLQGLALNDSSALSLTLPVLQNSVSSQNFKSIYNKVVTIYKSKAESYWTNKTISYSKIELLNNLKNINFKYNNLDLNKDISGYFTGLKAEVETKFDDQLVSINENTTDSKKEMVDLKRLNILYFNQRCEEAYSLAGTIHSERWQGYVKTAKLLALNCLHKTSQTPVNL